MVGSLRGRSDTRMTKRLIYCLLSAGLLLIGAITAITYPSAATAQSRNMCVRLSSGQVVTVQVPLGIAPPGTPVDASECLPAQAPQIQGPPPAAPNTNPPPASAAPAPKPGTGKPGGAKKPSVGTTPKDKAQANSKAEAKAKSRKAKGQADVQTQADLKAGGNKGKKGKKPATALRNRDGSPTASNPGYVDALPGPLTTSGVPNFIINKFKVPIFLLPIYQAAGIQYGVRWEVLAAINEIETDYGRNLNVSSAGALGWMQFIPSTWKMYGVDANRDGKKDPFNPVDAIFAAARYLKAAGYEKDARGAVFAYNHAGWYVDSVMLRAKLIAGVPADLIGSLTGLTEGRFPVAARARYADDLQEAEATKRVKRGQNAANIVESDASRSEISIFAKQGSPVVSTNDGQIKKIGVSKTLGRYITLQDVYGNLNTYAGLGSTAKYYPVPKADAAAASDPKRSARALKANGDKSDPKPRKAASAGRQPSKDGAGDTKKPTKAPASAVKGKRRVAVAREPRPAASVPVKQRLFAHPDLPQARAAGGTDQILAQQTSKGKGFETYKNYFSRPFGANAKDVRLTRLKVGSQVIGGTVLGRIGRPEQGKGSHLRFSIRPAGKGAPTIDPKPILDGWKLLEATAVYRASGRNALYGDDGASGLSIGQVLLLPKPLLEKKVLADPEVDIYPGGRDDIKSGQINRRVLATLEFLGRSGLRPTVSSLRGNHGLMTASGNISEHSSGNAVDISKINGIPIAGHQDPGGITEQAVRRLMRLQGTTQPHQIISLLKLGANTLALSDHADHIHVGFRPLYGDNSKLGQQALAVLKPGQWSDLLKRLRTIDNPVVTATPSKYSIPAGKRGSDAHRGD